MSHRSSAEDEFRAAFARLREGAPRVLARGTPVSQNNVAREAGVDPTALKKARFPTLVEDIQSWIAEHATASPPSARQRQRAARVRNRSLQERLTTFEEQRDLAQSLLVEADATILDLTSQVAQLRTELEKVQKGQTSVLQLIAERGTRE